MTPTPDRNFFGVVRIANVPMIDRSQSDVYS
jgi:hypothetical protein